ncbi:hypothetical protein EJ03DRAFT_280322 [Teratosphaeria nubilosa]|uniref:Cell wall protein n=1 Tax=Teratosphaeria nubilosa TaxID=161662 RepID=A0A6G1KXE8_9PEZI|nr:hypothetical protein EJ03DRAFT_280322 [Teratosphaeria nubilosa]
MTQTVPGASLAQAAPAEAKDGGGAGVIILADLKSINTATTFLTTKITAYQGGLVAAVPLGMAQNNVDLEIKKCTKHVTLSLAFSEADAQTAITYITGTLEASIAAAIQAITSKKSLFAASKLTTIVVRNLKTMKADTDALGAAMKAKVPSTQQQAAMATLTKIDEVITGGITAYSDSTGGGMTSTMTPTGASTGGGMTGTELTGKGMTGTEMTGKGMTGTELTGKGTTGTEMTEKGMGTEMTGTCCAGTGGCCTETGGTGSGDKPPPPKF